MDTPSSHPCITTDVHLTMDLKTELLPALLPSRLWNTAAGICLRSDTRASARKEASNKLPPQKVHARFPSDALITTGIKMRSEDISVFPSAQQTLFLSKQTQETDLLLSH